MAPPNGWGSFLAEQVGIAPYEIPVMIFSAVAIYLLMLASIRVFGTRILSPTTATDAVVVIMLGAVAGRAILGPSPTLSSGAIALVTLISLEAAFHGLQHASDRKRLFDSKPVLLFLDGEPLLDQCERTHTSVEDLNTVMRQSGAAKPDDVKCIILEPTGHYSVIRVGAELDVDMFLEVDGVEYLKGTES